MITPLLLLLLAPLGILCRGHHDKLSVDNTAPFTLPFDFEDATRQKTRSQPLNRRNKTRRRPKQRYDSSNVTPVSAVRFEFSLEVEPNDSLVVLPWNSTVSSSSSSTSTSASSSHPRTSETMCASQSCAIRRSTSHQSRRHVSEGLHKTLHATSMRPRVPEQIVYRVHNQRIAKSIAVNEPEVPRSRPGTPDLHLPRTPGSSRPGTPNPDGEENTSFHGTKKPGSPTIRKVPRKPIEQSNLARHPPPRDPDTGHAKTTGVSNDTERHPVYDLLETQQHSVTQTESLPLQCPCQLSMRDDELPVSSG